MTSAFFWFFRAKTNTIMKQKNSKTKCHSEFFPSPVPCSQSTSKSHQLYLHYISSIQLLHFPSISTISIPQRYRRMGSRPLQKSKLMIFFVFLMYTIEQSVKYTITLCLKNAMYIHYLKCLIAKENAKHHLSFQGVIIFLLVEGLDLTLLSAD